ncbi:GL15859 [Drosophila persimilis]|uniref:GL15859 n=1 Tax=Drosophila persimilis TaxID=7234 RepID=B4H0X1_DROPE|nr:GL15881 [Drosophila persimilis]EDW29889.1 GL15859 [Drosophila persimilis]
MKTGTLKAKPSVAKVKSSPAKTTALARALALNDDDGLNENEDVDVHDRWPDTKY